MTFTFDLLTSKVVSESRVTWATSVPILDFLGVSVLELGPNYATDRQINVRRQTASSPNALTQGAGHNKGERRYMYKVKWYLNSTALMLVEATNPTVIILNTQGLKCNFKAVGTVKISAPCKSLWVPFNFTAASCISSQAIILTKFRFHSSLRFHE